MEKVTPCSGSPMALVAKRLSNGARQVKNSSNTKCWPGKVKVGTKPSPSGTGETVNDCKDPKDL